MTERVSKGIFKIRDREKGSSRIVGGTIPELITSLNRDMSRFNESNNAWWKINPHELANFHLTATAALHINSSQEQNVKGLAELAMRDLRWKLTIGILQESLEEAKLDRKHFYESDLPDPLLEQRLLNRTPSEVLSGISDKTDRLVVAKTYHVLKMGKLVVQVITEKNPLLFMQDQQFFKDTLSLLEYSHYEHAWRRIAFLLREFHFPNSTDIKKSEFKDEQLPLTPHFNREITMIDRIVNVLHASGRKDILWMANNVEDVFAILFFQGLSKKESISFLLTYASSKVKDELLHGSSDLIKPYLPEKEFQPSQHAETVLQNYQQLAINDKLSLVFGLCKFPPLLKKVIQNDDELKLHMYGGYSQNRATFGLSPMVFLKRTTNSPL